MRANNIIVSIIIVSIIIVSIIIVSIIIVSIMCAVKKYRDVRGEAAIYNIKALFI